MVQIIETGITNLGMPSFLAGFLATGLILAPEVFNALKAASRGEVQRSMNTLYRSVVATVSLTVCCIDSWRNHSYQVILALEPFDMVLLA